MSGLRVLKFGGTSLADPERVRRVAEIVAGRATEGPTVVVVSAFAGVTDALSALARAAADGDLRYEEALEALAARHREAVRALVEDSELDPVSAAVEVRLSDLHDLVHGVYLVQECSPRTWDGILSFGERLSALLVAAAVRRAGVRARARDARQLVVTDDTFGRAWVDREATYARLREELGDAIEVPVVTGFIGGTPRRETTTLGRGGSDYTATLVGAALGAEAVEIWTDVDGVMSADPRRVPEAFPLPSLGYDELMELSHWGAKVVHPTSVLPTREAGIPLVIRNTLRPEAPGTTVTPEAPPTDGHPVRGIASIPRVALLRLEGPGLQGVPGIAQRLFGSLARDRISVILITQASSERSICFALEPTDVPAAVRSVEAEFDLERRAGLVDDLVVEEDCAVLSAVGEAMRETPGIAGRVFGVLGRHRINVRAIAQGSSELNISLVVAADDEDRALRAVHNAFFFPAARSVQLFQVGVGRVGGAFLSQLAAEAPRFRERRHLELRLTGLARSRAAVLRPEGLDLRRWEEALAGGGSGHFGTLVEAAIASDHHSRVFVDCTASADVVDAYEPLLREGVAVVTANKLAFSGDEPAFHALVEAGARGRGLYYETTVGAGLPILRTIHDLVSTGDAVQRIEGVLSGTLGFVLDRVSAGEDFSAVVREAHRRGYTEPDPREDLSGSDVARKLVILGRVAGVSLEPGDVEVTPLLPGGADGEWATMELDRFWEALPALDDTFAQHRRRAREEGLRLCYLARLDGDGGATVGLTALEPEHPCAGLRGTDNLVSVTTDRYADAPMVVRGPGAGPEVTAAGIFADVLRALAESP